MILLLSMIEFNKSDPFPLLEPSASYEDAKAHSALVDEWLGVFTEYVEQKILANGRYAQAKYESPMMPEYWSGLAIQTLQTPYVEIREMLSRLPLKSGDTVVDLGAAYGRMGHVIGRHYQNVQFVGYEFVSERVEEALRCLEKFNYTNVRLEVADLSYPKFFQSQHDFQNHT
jgi:cyclopropane fatty-acyl-phospholipid synthase-like methyltransferase